MFYLVGFLQDGIEDTEMFYILQMTCDHNCTAEGSCWDLLTVVVVVKRSLCVGAACWLWFVCFVSLDGCRVTFPLYYTSNLIPWPPRVPIEIGQHPLIRLLEMSPLKWSIIVSSLSVFLGSLCMYKQFRCCASLSLRHNLGAVRLADSVCHSPPCPTFCVWVTRLQIKNHLSLIFCPFFFFAFVRPSKKKNASTGGNYDSRFDVGKASGTLIVARPLDAEQKSNYNLTVEATDGTRTVSTQVIETLVKWFESWWGCCHGAVCLARERSDGQ